MYFQQPKQQSSTTLRGPTSSALGELSVKRDGKGTIFFPYLQVFGEKLVILV